MSVKTFGILTAYQPNIDFRHEGLGRYLAAFLKAASADKQLHFIIACPSWSRRSFTALFREAGIPDSALTLVGPKRPPLLLSAYSLIRRRPDIERKKRPWWAINFKPAVAAIRGAVLRHVNWVGATVAQSRNIVIFLLAVVYALLLALVAAPFVAVRALWRALWFVRSKRPWRRWPRLTRFLGRAKAALAFEPRHNRVFRSLYASMQERENQLLLREVESQSSVIAWYCPTPFWPSFNSMTAPRLVCVPDIVFTEFPVGFSLRGGDRTVTVLNDIQATVLGNATLVTYSDFIKWEYLVGRFGAMPQAIHPIPHAANDLSPRIAVTGFPDMAATSRAYAERLLLFAIRKAHNLFYARQFENKKVRFIFYASQFRPSKNILTLLRAYEHLLRRSRIPHKLFLTGFVQELPEVAEFLEKHNLNADVLCVHGLTESELAACYALADIAVNPSLSEGAMPFTYTEALSVNTPVIMSDIPVTREIIVDEDLRQATLFDPYDWKALADKIEWALNNRTPLLAQQRKFYDEVLSKRTWDHVVAEHIALLEEIGAAARPPA